MVKLTQINNILSSPFMQCSNVSVGSIVAAYRNYLRVRSVPRKQTLKSSTPEAELCPERTLRGCLFHIDREACAYSGGAVEVIACLEKADEVDFGKILPHLNERDT